MYGSSLSLIWYNRSFGTTNTKLCRADSNAENTDIANSDAGSPTVWRNNHS